MKQQYGNALFLILIAIFLLGGLSVLLSRSSSDSEDTGNIEQASIQASTVIRYASGIETAIQAMLSRGCGENQISFWYADTNASGGENAGDDYYNADAPASHACHVFDVRGGAVTYKDIGKVIGSSMEVYYGSNTAGRRLIGIGTDKNDLYLQIYSNAAGNRTYFDPFCEAVNKIAGIQKTGTAPAGSFDPYSAQIVNITGNIKFTGTYSDVAPTVFTITGIVGKKFFCTGIAATKNVFAAVILTR